MLWFVGFVSVFTQLTKAKKQFCDALSDVDLHGCFSAQTLLNKAAVLPGGWVVIPQFWGTNFAIETFDNAPFSDIKTTTDHNDYEILFLKNLKTELIERWLLTLTARKEKCARN